VVADLHISLADQPVNMFNGLVAPLVQTSCPSHSNARKSFAHAGCIRRNGRYLDAVLLRGPSSANVGKRAAEVVFPLLDAKTWWPTCQRILQAMDRNTTPIAILAWAVNHKLQADGRVVQRTGRGFGCRGSAYTRSVSVHLLEIAPSGRQEVSAWTKLLPELDEVAQKVAAVYPDFDAAHLLETVYRYNYENGEIPEAGLQLNVTKAACFYGVAAETAAFKNKNQAGVQLDRQAIGSIIAGYVESSRNGTSSRFGQQLKHSPGWQVTFRQLDSGVPINELVIEAWDNKEFRAFLKLCHSIKYGDQPPSAKVSTQAADSWLNGCKRVDNNVKGTIYLFWNHGVGFKLERDGKLIYDFELC